VTSERTIEEVQGKIDRKEAKVYTASEFKGMLRSGKCMGIEDVDVVTCGTFGVMSGTMAVFTVPITDQGVFKRADSITMNGVPGNVGPCPNESLGLVDCIFYGTARRDGSYGGGHLFRDLVSREPVEVSVMSEGRRFSKVMTLDDIPYAKMIMIRSGFKNYTGFANGSADGVTTIFSGPEPMGGCMSEASVSGCGELNPLENDPTADYLRCGSSVMLNGAPGMILGEGTRSSPGKPNLSIQADMHMMRSDLMGGFRTSEGPECLISIAAAIPVTSKRSLDALSVMDEDVVLPLADVRDRKPMYEDRYSSVWKGTDIDVKTDRSRCLDCDDCLADRSCPVDAGPSKGPDPSLCMSCGICVRACVGGVFKASLGELTFGGTRVPIGTRQSSRFKADRSCRDLKDKVENGEWNLRC